MGNKTAIMIMMGLLFLVFPFKRLKAATPGAYIGLAGGWSELGTPDDSVYLAGTGTDTTSSDSQVIINNKIYRNGIISGFIYTGYNINRYIGAEISYNHYTYATYATKQTNIDAVNPSNNSVAKAEITFKTHTYNLVIVTYAPILEYMDIYTRYGIAYVHQNVYHTSSRSNEDVNFHAILDTTKLSHPYRGNNITTGFRPTLGIGVNFKLNDAWSAGFAYDYTFGTGNLATNKNAIASLYMTTMNVTYNFG